MLRINQPCGSKNGLFSCFVNGLLVGVQTEDMLSKKYFAQSMKPCASQPLSIWKLRFEIHSLLVNCRYRSSRLVSCSYSRRVRTLPSFACPTHLSTYVCSVGCLGPPAEHKIDLCRARWASVAPWRRSKGARDFLGHKRRGDQEIHPGNSIRGLRRFICARLGSGPCRIYGERERSTDSSERARASQSLFDFASSPVGEGAVLVHSITSPS